MPRDIKLTPQGVVSFLYDKYLMDVMLHIVYGGPVAPHIE